MMRCVLADSGIHVRPNGDITMCCDQASLRINAKDYTLQQVYKSPEFLIRDNHQGIKDASCNICWLSEDAGLDSPRTRFSDMHEDSEHLSHWDIRDDNLCNMACRICILTVAVCGTVRLQNINKTVWLFRPHKRYNSTGYNFNKYYRSI